MARKNKPARQKNEVEEWQQHQDEQISVGALVKDERTHKISGTVFLLFAVLLFIAFTSYLFTWQQDQDKVLRPTADFLLSDTAPVENLLGRLGAWGAHILFYESFGIAAYLFCSLFFVIGINLLLGSRMFSVWRNVRYVLVGLLVLPVCFSFFLHAYSFPWGGAFGNFVSDWLNGFMGKTGTAVLLLVAFMSYIIWRFNPVFRFTTAKAAAPPAPADTELQGLAAEAAAIKADRQETVPQHTGNTLSGMLPVLDIQETASEENPLHQFELKEVDELPAAAPQPLHAPAVALETVQPSIPPTAVTDLSDEPLELEIKNASALQHQAEPTAQTVVENQPPYDPFLDLKDYKFPSLNLLENHGSEKIVQDAGELENYKNQIISTLRNYDIEIQKISATVGPTVTLYEIVPAAGVRISRIKNLEDDIALSLAALGIRIIAPIPGKGTIGIEVPNVKKTVVSMKTLLSSEKFQHNHFSLPIAIGKRIDNENFIVDLASMPHLLMAGATGQGKSVGLNAILVSLLYKKHPSQLKLVLVDPKKVELSLYRHIEKHFLAKLPGEEESIITDTKKVINTLNALCIEMDNRYDLLKEAGCRNLREYNDKFVARKLNPQKGHQYLPFIVLVIDEFADLIMTAGKEVEMPIARLAQLARAVGIHLIIATQRPSVNIITGTIKANFPARIAFKVSSKVDSRTILDTGGAEQLIGKGDMLISYNGELTRLQCAFVDTPEVDEVVNFISRQRGYPQAFLLPEYIDEKDLEGRDVDLGDRDPLFEDAARLIVQNQVGSTSLLQRRMKLGYNRAGRLMDQLEAAGVVGNSQGSKARDVLIKTEAELDQYLREMGI